MHSEKTMSKEEQKAFKIAYHEARNAHNYAVEQSILNNDLSKTRTLLEKEKGTHQFMENYALAIDLNKMDFIKLFYENQNQYRGSNKFLQHWLVYSIKKEHMASLEYLAQKEALDENTVLNCLKLATKHNQKTTIEFFLSQKGYEENHKHLSELLKIAANIGNFPLFKFWLDKINYKNFDENLGLMNAGVRGGNLNILNSLIFELKIPINNAVYEAVKKNDLDLVKYLLISGADINYDAGKALAYAVNRKDKEICKFLMINGVDPNTINYNNYSGQPEILNSMKSFIDLCRLELEELNTGNSKSFKANKL